ncbi:MAG: hypothetical protein Phog2KO_08060 [Phototrophicaceae bacterium]
MQSGYTGYVDRSEWWWTTIVSLTFIIFTFLPFFFIVLTNPIQSDTQFMGAIHDIEDASAQIARMQQGADGSILLDFLYSPQTQDTALIHPVYAILGQLVRYSQLSPTIIFHLLRIFVSLFMYLAIYNLGASIWVRIRTRRIFFVLSSVGAGFGWVAIFFLFNNDNIIIPDISLPQAFPIYASASNIHYPLAIACITLIASVCIAILRPGESENPSAENQGSLVFISSLILALIYPDALIPLGIAYTLNVLINWYTQKKVSQREWYWGLWILVPALPIATYYLLTIANNPFVASWINQRSDISLPLPILLVSVGLPLIIALPALLRAIRNFEPDGDRFMLLWLLSMIITLYLPLQLKQYFLVGLMLPIGYFATRAIEDFWFQFIRRTHRSKVYVVIFPFLILSHIIWIFIPIYPLIVGWNGLSPSLLEQDHSDALIWIDQNIEDNHTILASPAVSLWIPSWTGNRVVYGHSAETFNAEEARSEVISWYAQDDPQAESCRALIEEYQVDFVLRGPRENHLGSSACTDNLAPIAFIGSITLYATEFAD